MGNDGTGDSSPRKDDNPESGKPFKKARYAWEVKGKLHLKNNTQQQNSNNDPEQTTSTAGQSMSRDVQIISRDEELTFRSEQNEFGNEPFDPIPNNNDEGEVNNNYDISMNNNNYNFEDNNITGNHNAHTNRCCTETIAARSERIMDLNNPEEDLGSPSRTNENQSPPTPPSPRREGYSDYYLLRWQTRQVARGYVDNTINRVLEHWMVAPSCDCDGNVIDEEAILMAIQSHGLRQESRGSAEEPLDSHIREGVQSTRDNNTNAHNETRNVEGDGANFEDDDENETDFLDAAVSVAISKKGLSTSSFE